MTGTTGKLRNLRLGALAGVQRRFSIRPRWGAWSVAALLVVVASSVTAHAEQGADVGVATASEAQDPPDPQSASPSSDARDGPEPSRTPEPSRPEAPGAPEVSSAPEVSGVREASADHSGAREDPEPRSSWRQQFEKARSVLADGDHGQAARLFDELAKSASSQEDRLLAEEYADVAKQRSADQQHSVSPLIRTSEELSLLYIAGFVYGAGTGAWAALHLNAEHIAVGILPMAGLAAVSLTAISYIDESSPFKRGLPHSIAAGGLLGVGEAVWLMGYRQSISTRRADDSAWRYRRASTVLWAGATLGTVAGGFVGYWGDARPGDVSFVTSSAVWAGLFGSFAGTAIQRDPDRRSETAFATGGISYNVGMAAGALFAGQVNASSARVRFSDLGGLIGALAATGSYFLIVDEPDTPEVLTATGVGGLVGLGLTWWATSDMDRQRPDDYQGHESSISWVPLLTPTTGGLVAGIGGTL